MYQGAYGTIWRLLANTGLRRGEALTLRWSQIDGETIRVVSTGEERTKSGQWRVVPIPAGAKTALAALRTDPEFVIPRMHPASLSRACIKAVKRAGLIGSLHTLRHTYISHLVMAGVDLRTVQKLAGHSNITVTMRYAHLAPGHLLDAGRKIDL